MNILLRLLRRLLPVLLLAAPAALFAAGYEPDSDMAPPGASSGGPERRTVGLFTRLFNSPAKTNAAEQLAFARDLESRKYVKHARKAYKAAFLFYPNSEEAPVALLSYARLLQQDKHYGEAFSEYQYLIDTYGGRFAYTNMTYDDIIQQQYALAGDVETERYGRWFFGIGFVSAERAIPLYFQVASNAPTRPEAPVAIIRSAAIFQKGEDYDSAIRAYADLQTRYPETDQAKEAAYQMVNCMMAIAHRQRNNTQHTLNTLAALEQYKKDHADDPRMPAIEANLAELNGRQARTLMDRAYVYERAGKNETAIALYQQVVDQYTTSELANKANLKIKSLSLSPSPKEPPK
jgi:tetratricopeptide (TPR) repeat protein